MLRLLTDENFDGRVLRGLLARTTNLDVLRVQDAGLSGAADPAILDFAARERRVLLTHDVHTMTAFAAERLAAGQPVAGMVVVPQVDSIGRVIEALQEIVETREAEELRDRVLRFPQTRRHPQASPRGSQRAGRLVCSAATSPSAAPTHRCIWRMGGASSA